MGRHSIFRGYRRLSECALRGGVGSGAAIQSTRPLSDKERAKQARHAVRTSSANIVTEFNRQFGDITCRGLIGMDFSKPGEYLKFLDSGVWKDKCVKYVEFMIEKLYALEDRQELFVQAP